MGKLFTPQNLNSGFNSNASLTANFEAIESAFDKTLSRTGESPNAMESPLDMNGQSIINVGSLLTSDLEVEGISIIDQVNAAEDAAESAQTAQAGAETAATNASNFADEAEAWANQAESAYNNILYADIVTETNDFELTYLYTNKIIFAENVSGLVVTLSESAIQGTQAVIVQKGTGTVSFQVEGTDSLLSFDNLSNTAGDGAAVTAIKISDGWFIGGNLS